MATIISKLDDKHIQNGKPYQSVTIGKEYEVIERDDETETSYVLIKNDYGLKFWYTVGENI